MRVFIIEWPHHSEIPLAMFEVAPAEQGSNVIFFSSARDERDPRSNKLRHS